MRGWGSRRQEAPGALASPGGRGTKGVQVDLDTMVREYRELLSVDPKTGLPPMKVLQELGLAGYLR
jgi:hypothetical protein